MLCSKMTRRFGLMLALLFCASPLWGNTGKFAGRVVDKQSGDPLPGVNVIVDGTNRGAATNANGEYVILNIPPGDYTLRASFIGYAILHVQNLRISSGNTTRQNFSMSPETLEGEEVVIVAERPLVQKDLTASQKVTTAAEIKNLPVESFFGVVTTQAGVNKGADGAIHIRGGRTNEIGYYIDGISVSNPFFTNSLATNVSNKALEEIKVVSGAFNAEYGNAMSGIINLSLKEGGREYHGSFSAYTGDYISNNDDIFANIDDRDPFASQVFEGALNGPIPGMGNKLTFNLSGRYSDTEGFLYGIRQHLPGDSANFAGDDWFVQLSGDSAFVPMEGRTDFNWVSKLTWRLRPNFKVSGQVLYDRGRWKDYSHAYRFNPDGTYNFRDDNYNYSLKINHAFTKSFYEAHVFFSTTDFRQFAFEDENDPRYVPTSRQIGEPSSPHFVFSGTQMGRVFRESESMGFKIDYTSQLHPRHEVKTGVSLRQDNLQERNATVLFDNIFFRSPTVLPENESPTHTFYDRDMTHISAYVQDKVEYNSFILNAGVRFDRYDPNSSFPINLLDPEGEQAPASIKQRVSPRLGVAFPITDTGILHFSYGHFYQVPTLRRLYQTSIFGAGNRPTLGYSDLNPEKTVNFEFGLQQQLGDAMAVELSLFNKDIRDLLALQTIRYESARFGPSTYNVYLNKDYGSVRGFTLSLTKRYDQTSKLQAWLDYTFQTTDGNDVRSGSFFFSALSGIEEEKRIVPLGWDQTHVLNATVSVSDPRNWSVSFIGRASSGWPYTPDVPFANYVPDANSGRKPWQISVDVNASKNFNVGKYSFVGFVRVFNLLDRRNERFVFDDTGSAAYTFVNRSGQETREFISHYGEPGIHTWNEYQDIPTYYTAPRLARGGLSFEF